jgi:hypothetical protein
MTETPQESASIVQILDSLDLTTLTIRDIEQIKNPAIRLAILQVLQSGVLQTHHSSSHSSHTAHDMTA